MLPRVVVFVWMVEMLNLVRRVLNSLVAEGWNGAKKVEEGAEKKVYNMVDVLREGALR
jgi:hypothetical protein